MVSASFSSGAVMAMISASSSGAVTAIISASFSSGAVMAMVSIIVLKCQFDKA